MEDDKKKLEIVSGDGKDLEISPVYGHLNTLKPNFNNKPKNIVIPKPKNDDEKEKKQKKENKKGGN